MRESGYFSSTLRILKLVENRKIGNSFRISCLAPFNNTLIIAEPEVRRGSEDWKQRAYKKGPLLKEPAVANL